MTDVVTSEAELSGGWQRRRARILDHIERCALELFAEHPADEITVERIAQSAGISKRTFFRYFSTRDEVLTMMPARQVTALCARVAARPAAEGVLDAFLGAIEQGEGDDAAHDDRIFLWGRALRNGAGLQMLGQTGGPQMSAFVDVIADREGLDPGDLHVRAWAAAIASNISASFVHWLEAGGVGSLPEVMVHWLLALDQLSLGASRAPSARKRT